MSLLDRSEMTRVGSNALNIATQSNSLEFEWGATINPLAFQAHLQAYVV